MENRKRNSINVPEWMGAAIALAAFLYAVLISVLCIWISGPAIPPTGDEPHYLIVAHSLAMDGDLSLANNYQERQYRIFYSGILAKRTSPSADLKRELPAQGLGLSFLLAPLYKLILNVYPPALVITLRLLMCSITVIVLYQLLKLLPFIEVQLRAGLLVICGAGVASPILTYSSLFYPEIPACLMVVIALRQLFEMEEHRWRALFWLALIPGALIWFHPKYLALSICILISAAVFFYRTFRIYPGGMNVRLVVLHTILSAAGIVSFFLFLHAEYGGWSPNRIYAGWDKAPQSLFDLIQQEGIARIGTMLRMSLGLWIDQRFGLIPYAPLFLLFFPGVAYMLRAKTSARFILFWFVLHFLILCWGAPLGGFAPPSRHMIVLLPIVLIAVCYAFSQYSGSRKVFAMLLFAMSWLIETLMYLDYRSLFTNVTWRNPDGLSPFWQRYRLESFIPILTASDPNWFLIINWCLILAALTWFFYPRDKKILEDHS